MSKLLTTLRCKLLSQEASFKSGTGSEFASGCKKLKVSCEQQKSYIMVFWNGIFCYPAGILHVQSQQFLRNEHVLVIKERLT